MGGEGVGLSVGVGGECLGFGWVGEGGRCLLG